ncbi:hypothetical protein [Phosphitispora fastidiosa]|uniref:hypothetical protein n=1 Tax=Phosphitispora fastidiosa TaxID=2837202 RepID=UPI001E400BE8|nr:hypothetical protein [Phosphitispora fastidiosa]MBU7007385.1 hypothetical protein [Phosphitispora fastidiosa]
MQKSNEPWEMLADKKIWAFLGDSDRELTQDYVRLMFIELFNRVKNLEMENNTLKVLLFQYELVEEKVFFDALSAVREFFREWDEERAKEVDFYSKSGISFVDWAAFVKEGKFDKSYLKNN